MNYTNIVEYKGSKITEGRKLFNECLPEDHELIDYPVRKNELLKILNEIALRYSPEVTMRTLDNIKDLGFKVCTEKGFSLGMDDLYDEQLEKIANSLKQEDSISSNLEKMNDPKIIERIQNKPYYIYIKSGARGSIEQVKQLVFCRGYVADANNKIRSGLIKSNLATGLTEKEYFESSWGCRKGLMDTAVSTGTAGYLTRQLIYSTIEMELDDVEDCGTTDGLNLLISVRNDDLTINDEETESLAKSLLWRNIIDEEGKTHLITTKNYKQLIGKRIKVKSPIYCKNKKICKKCYGNLHKILHSDQIGMIATHAVGERTVQLVLKNFHTSGSVSKATDDGDNDDIISGIDLVNKLLHAGDVARLKTPGVMVKKLQQIFGRYGNIHLVHFETIVACMMWSENKKWRLLPNRENEDYTFESILQIPSKSSWLVGAAFSRIKSKLLEGLINNRVDVPSSLSSIFRY